MPTLSLLICVLFLSSAINVFAQFGTAGQEKGFFTLNPATAGPTLQFNAVLEPPLANPAELKLGWGVLRATTRNQDVWHRFVYDTVHQQYFGYDLLVDPPQLNLLTNQPQVRNQYRVTFAPLSLDPTQIEPKGLSLIPLAKYPEPQLLMPGDIIAVDLLISPNGKRKLVDYIQLSVADGVPLSASRIARFDAQNQPTRLIYERFGRIAGIHISFDPAFLNPPPPASPKFNLSLLDATPEEALNLIAIVTHTYWKPAVGNSILIMPKLPRLKSTETPKDYSVDDGPLKFDFIGEVLINNQPFTGQTWFIASKGKGATPWFYFPGQGRFILSLVPHPGFSKAGEIRDNAISFRSDGQKYQITMNSPVIEGGGAWNLYLLHAKSYQLSPSALAELPNSLPRSGVPLVVGGTDRLDNLITK